MNGEFDFTVHNLITRGSTILLVKERGENGGKPPGWGMPGGSVLISPEDRSLTKQEVLQRSFDQINNFVERCGIDSEAFEQLLKSKPPIDLLFFLTSVREALEEIAVLVQPICEVFRETAEPRSESHFESSHQVIIMQSHILDGEPSCNCSEIDDLAWYEFDSLPLNMYPSHRRRMSAAIRKLRLNELKEMVHAR